MGIINIPDFAGASVAVEKPNGNGQATMANSRPVVIASNQTPVPITLDAAALAALEFITVTGPLTDTQLRATPVSTLADSYARNVITANLVRLANTNAYAAGQLVGASAAANNAANRMIVPGVSRTPGGVVQIPRLRLYKSQATLLGQFDIILFRGDPAPALSADATSFAAGTAIGSAAVSKRIVGRFAADFTQGVAGTDGVEVGCVPRIGSYIQTAPVTGESDLYAVIVATGAYAPASGEIFNIVAEVLSY